MRLTSKLAVSDTDIILVNTIFGVMIPEMPVSKMSVPEIKKGQYLLASELP